MKRVHNYRVQVAAYALLLERAAGVEVSKAYYSKSLTVQCSPRLRFHCPKLPDFFFCEFTLSFCHPAMLLDLKLLSRAYETD
jgi:hypothetical protein